MTRQWASKGSQEGSYCPRLMQSELKRVCQWTPSSEHLPLPALRWGPAGADGKGWHGSGTEVSRLNGHRNHLQGSTRLWRLRQLSPRNETEKKEGTAGRRQRDRGLVHCQWKCQTVRPLWKSVEAPQKIKCGLNIGPSSSPSGSVPKRAESRVCSTHSHTRGHSSLFTRARRWKQPCVR